MQDEQRFAWAEHPLDRFVRKQFASRRGLQPETEVTRLGDEERRYFGPE